MISIYGTIYNAIKFNFDYKRAIANYCGFLPNCEVIIVVNESEDDTLAKVQDLTREFDNLIVKTATISYDNNRFDGLLKQEALNYCSYPIRCLFDLDEVVAYSNRDKWIDVIKYLENSNYDGLMIPTIDLWGSETQIRANVPIGQKFRLHKEYVKRGVWNKAKLENGFILTEKSDTTEGILGNGELANFISLVTPEDLKPENSAKLAAYPYVIHEGYKSFANRVKLAKEFWKEKWEQRSGHEENVITDENLLAIPETICHNLSLI